MGELIFTPFFFFSLPDEGTQRHWEEARVGDLFVFQMENPGRPPQALTLLAGLSPFATLWWLHLKINPAWLKPDLLVGDSRRPGTRSGRLGTRGQLLSLGWANRA